MSDPKRLVTLKALTAHLEGITPANGYTHDLTGRVHRGRVRFGEETEIPCLNILEPLNPDREPRSTDEGLIQNESWIVMIQGWVPDDVDNPTDPAHVLMAEVKMRLAVLAKDTYPQVNPVYMLGGNISSLGIEPGTVRPPDETSSRAYFYLRISLGFVEDLSDPFAL